VNHELYVTLEEANFDLYESVSSILEHTGERADHLRAHILETKRNYWNLIRTACDLPEPPETLLEVMRYELEMVQHLTQAQLEIRLDYGREMSVAQLLRLSARHSVWHAGQIALTRG
jgi:uncharacterized damage-inducible protein DinB